MHLIIYAHPNPDSFTHALLEHIVQASNEVGKTSIVRDLYQLNFNPVLSWEELNRTFEGKIAEDIEQEQQLINAATHITLVYPLWWMGYPAILKGYLDRVLTFGFAYRTDENDESVGLLQDKRLFQFINIGRNWQEFVDLGYHKSIDDMLGTGLFNFCGITHTDYHVFDDIHKVNRTTLTHYLDKAKLITMDYLSK